MRNFIVCIIVSVFSFSLFSCSDSEADVISASATTVFDYKDKESVPEQRLAVFLQVSNAAQRTDSFTVSNEESGYSWEVIKPGIFKGLNKEFAYSINLNPPEGGEIPVGVYTVVYYDAAENKDEARFSVNYKKELITSNAENFLEFLQNPNENVAVYDDSGELLYMGKTKPAWKSNYDILRDYKLAETKRICYVTPGNNVICLLPKEKLKETENGNSKDED